MEDVDRDAAAEEISELLNKQNTIKTKLANGSVATRPRFTPLTKERVKEILDKLENSPDTMPQEMMVVIRRSLDTSEISHNTKKYLSRFLGN